MELQAKNLVTRERAEGVFSVYLFLTWCYIDLYIRLLLTLIISSVHACYQPVSL